MRLPCSIAMPHISKLIHHSRNVVYSQSCMSLYCHYLVTHSDTVSSLILSHNTLVHVFAWVLESHLNNDSCNLCLSREWMQMNNARAQELSEHAHYIEPTPTKAALGHSRHAGSDSCGANSPHKSAVQNFKLSKFVKLAKHKVDDSKPNVMDTIRPVRDVRINGQTQASLVV